MQTICYVDLMPRRRTLAENLMTTAQQSALSLQDNGVWVQLANTRAPHVMLSIHAEEDHAQALADVHGLMRQLDELCEDGSSASLEQLLSSVHFLLEAHPRHHIQL